MLSEFEKQVQEKLKNLGIKQNIDNDKISLKMPSMHTCTSIDKVKLNDSYTGDLFFDTSTGKYYMLDINHNIVPISYL